VPVNLSLRNQLRPVSRNGSLIFLRGEFKIGLIAAERAPHLTNTVLDDARVSDRAWARREAMVAFAGYPLLVGERLIGVMAMFARHILNDAVGEGCHRQRHRVR
jgi:GAF domain-containing protein